MNISGVGSKKTRYVLSVNHANNIYACKIKPWNLRHLSHSIRSSVKVWTQPDGLLHELTSPPGQLVSSVSKILYWSGCKTQLRMGYNARNLRWCMHEIGVSTAHWSQHALLHALMCQTDRQTYIRGQWHMSKMKWRECTDVQVIWMTFSFHQLQNLNKVDMETRHVASIPMKHTEKCACFYFFDNVCMIRDRTKNFLYRPFYFNYKLALTSA